MSVGERHAPGHTASSEEQLAVAVQRLSDRIEALQADVRRLGAPGLPVGEPGWEGEEQAAASPSYAWVSAVQAPVRHRPRAPRLLLEVLFLAAAAAAAAAAELDAAQIGAVMTGSWVLVALIEWAASRAERRRDEIPGPSVRQAPPEPPGADPAWFVPPVEQTLIEAAGDSPTAVTRLPPAIEQTVDFDATVSGRPGDDT